MPDLYTEQKLAIQGQFVINSLAQYTGQRKALHGTVKIIGHERKGGIIVEADGVVATVSPFSLLPVASVRPRSRGKRPEAPQNGHTPTARIFRDGVELVPDKSRKPTVKITPTVEPDPLARLRGIGQPTTPNQQDLAVRPDPAPAPQPTLPPPITPPLGTLGVERFFYKWLKDWRTRTPHPKRQAIIDAFTLPTFLRDHVPTQPGLYHYRAAIYFITAAMLADPARVPPLADIQVLLSDRFKVTQEAVKVHVKWMRKRLEADHAKFVATQHATVGVTQ